MGTIWAIMELNETCKKLHQQSDSSTKPEHIFGHSCQAVSVLMRAAKSIFSVPLTCCIHEGVVFSNREKRTLLDKMILLVDALDIDEPFIFVADAYRAGSTLSGGLRGIWAGRIWKPPPRSWNKPDGPAGDAAEFAPLLHRLMTSRENQAPCPCKEERKWDNGRDHAGLPAKIMALS